MLTSSGFDAFIHLRYISSIDSSKMIGKFPEISNSNQLFLDSTGSSATNRRFFSDIDSGFPTTYSS